VSGRTAFAVLALALALVGARPAAAGTGMFVGAADDGARSLDPLAVKAKMDLAALAGFGVVRMTVTWSPGEQTVGGDDRVVLQNASAAAQLDGVRLMLTIAPRDWRTTPLSSRARGEFAQYAASIARRFPAIRDFVIGNEPNLNRFWMPQFGADGADLAARSYELLLARTYDALKSVAPDVNVIGGALSPRGQDKAGSARQTHSPTTFIRDLGAAYRSDGRRRPIMDMFAIHPYLIPSQLPPTFSHPRTTTIGIADYPKLVRLLTNAFAGTAQRGETLPIVYDEFGYQSRIPARKQSLYTHLGAAAARDAIPEAQQAAYYRQAFALAACQPTVAGLLIFHVADERDARAWQSGVYYRNGTPKSSLAAVRDAALTAHDGTLAHCSRSKTTSNLGDVVFHEPSTAAPRMLQLDFSCALPCSYQAQVIDAQTGEVVAAATGKAVAGLTVAIPADGAAPGSYQYVLHALKCGKPGTAEARYSRSFTLAAAEPGGEPIPPDPTAQPDPTTPPDPAASPPPPPPPPLLLLPERPRLPPARSPLPTLLPTVPATT
jgi:transposase InsO family protein